MKGYIILYNTSNRKDITNINYELFGRIIVVPKGNDYSRYYYPGCFENTRHIKLSNGCYFVLERGSDCNGMVKYIDADLGIPSSVLVTARQKREEYANRKGFKVKHLNC